MATVFLVASALNPCLFSSCTVKENRDPCPALLRLGLPAESDSLKELYITVENPYGEEVTYRRPLAAADTFLCFQVTREKFLLTVSSVNLAGGYSASTGEPYPRLYLYRARVRIGGENATITPTLEKDYCTMEIGLTSPGKDLGMRVCSNYSGTDRAGNLIRSGYSVATVPGGIVRVPRQGDNSLSLEIVDPEDDGILRSFAIGEYLYRAGYDWAAPSLEDVTVQINYARSTINFSTWYWDKTFDIAIDL